MQRGLRVAVVGAVPQSIVRFRGPLLEAMVTRGHQVTACTAPASSMLVRTVERLGVDFRDVPFDRTGLNPVADLGVLRALVGVFKEIRPDVVLSYTIKPVIYGSLAARIARVPKIFSMIEGLGYAFGADSLKQSLIGRAAKLLYRCVLPHNSRVFFLNPDDQAAFARYGLLTDQERSVLLNGIGVDLDYYEPAPLPAASSFLFMGRFLRDKGIGEFVEAARLVKHRHPDATFRLVGEIDSSSPSAIRESELMSWVNEGVVEYLGHLEDVRPALAGSSVFVLPSYYPEGQPRTIMEAMAMGRAIITTDSPGCRETVEHGRNGYLIPVRNVGALVRRMEQFIEEPAQVRCMGRESRSIAEAKYNVHDVNRVIMDAMGLT